MTPAPVCNVSVPEPLSAGDSLRIVTKMVGILPRWVSTFTRRDDAASGEVLDTLAGIGTLDVSLPVDGIAAGLGKEVAAENLVRGIWVFTLQVLDVYNLTLITR